MNDNPAERRTAAVAATLRHVLDQALADSAFPAAYAVVGNSAGVVASYGVGHLEWTPSPAPSDSTIWDLASLTKVVGLTTALMQLADDGQLVLDAPVQRYLPEWTGPGKERVTVRQLLTHSSGLPAWRPLYKESWSPQGALVLAYATPLDTMPGVRVLYSDLGAILLGQIVERLSGDRLDVFLARRVFGPLHMTTTGYRPSAAFFDRIAPTEYDPWRQRHLRGEVHDENAFALGGISGHAGLFSTARDLTRFAMMVLRGGELDSARLVSPEILGAFTAEPDPPGSGRALGWEKPTGDNSAGRRMSPRAFGHTGFTGTSLWIDPERDAFVLLLSNRVNPTRENRRIAVVRRALADAVMAALDATAPPAAAAAPSSAHHTPPPTRQRP